MELTNYVTGSTLTSLTADSTESLNMMLNVVYTQFKVALAILQANIWIVAVVSIIALVSSFAVWKYLKAKKAKKAWATKVK